MTTKSIIIVLVAVIVIGGGVLILKKSAPSSEVSNSTQSNSEATTSASGKKMAFDAFLKQGGSYTCTIAQHVGGMTNTGTLYINNKNIRGDFSAAVAGKNITSSFVQKDGFMYVWNSMTPGTGFKMAIVAEQNTSRAPGTVSLESSGFDASNVGDYDCKAWTPVAAQFALPSSVTFTEVMR
jgi:hypothetical protein